MWLCRHASGNLHPSRRNSFWEARERKEGEENTQQAIMTTARRRLWQPHHRCPVHSHSCATGGAWVTWWGGWEGEQPHLQLLYRDEGHSVVLTSEFGSVTDGE